MSGLSLSSGSSGQVNDPQLGDVDGRGHDSKPVFEMLVLGSGGGPLESDCSGWVSCAVCPTGPPTPLLRTCRLCFTGHQNSKALMSGGAYRETCCGRTSEKLDRGKNYCRKTTAIAAYALESSRRLYVMQLWYWDQKTPIRSHDLRLRELGDLWILNVDRQIRASREIRRLTTSYLVKPYVSNWEDGILALEGGSGLGALVTLLTYEDEKKLFPELSFPPLYNTPVLKASYVFSYITIPGMKHTHIRCYLITHAHLDHTLSLITLSGSAPPRPPPPEVTTEALPSPVTITAPESTPSTSNDLSPSRKPDPSPAQPRLPVFGTLGTLERLSVAYAGGLWPELGKWSKEALDDLNRSEESKKSPEDSKRRSKRRKVVSSNHATPSSEKKFAEEDDLGGTGVLLSPMIPSKMHRPLHPSIPITTLVFPVSHGCTSHGAYESSAVFVRYDPEAIGNRPIAGAQENAGPPPPTPPRTASNETTLSVQSVLEQDLASQSFREFLFFGDVESDYRASGEENVDSAGRERAKRLNGEIWNEAASSWIEGRLAAVFIECSYDSSRPASLMFGHVSPPGLYHELRNLASRVVALRQESSPSIPEPTEGDTASEPPLSGLKVYITHIKDSLIPHSSGKSARERIMSELVELERTGQLGIEFVEVKRGDRILI